MVLCGALGGKLGAEVQPCNILGNKLDVESTTGEVCTLCGAEVY